MTTETTERWDATWSDTGEHPAVNVTSAAPLDGPIYTAEDAQRLATQNARLSKQVRHLTDLVERLTEDKRAAHLDLERLQAELHPLDERRTGWTPGPKAMPRRHWTQVSGVADLTEQQQHAALVPPTLTELRDGDGEHYLGAVVAAEMMAGVDHRPGWPTWLGDVHHADATWTQAVTDLRSWADGYAARPVEHTVVEPVEEDTSWRFSKAALYARMVVEAAERHVDSVYDELAPERIQADVPPDDRVQRMTDEPERYFAEARERAERQVQAESGADLEPPPADRTGLDKLKERVPTALTTGEQPAAEPEPEPPRIGGWRVWAASAAIGIVGLAATIGALVVWA